MDSGDGHMGSHDAQVMVIWTQVMVIWAHMMLR